jgi:hypothetical protein
MTGHTGYITHARKILKLPSQEISQTISLEKTVVEEEPAEQEENIEEIAEKQTA